MPNPISNLEVKINNNNLNKKINLQNEFKIFEHTVETQNFLRSAKEGQTGSQIPTVEEYIKSPVTMTLNNTLQKMTEKNVVFDKLPIKLDPTLINKNTVSPTESPYLNPRSFLLKYGYDIIKKIGEGSFSKVYSATHILSNRIVAIKCLDKKKIIQNYALTERVFREITLLKSINHKNICQLLQLIDSPQYIHMVLEYESGGELYDEIVKKTRLSPEDCQVYFKQLVSAIDYCHNLGIVHRDLKPENILLDKHKKNVKIIDFGFSNLIKDNSYKLGTFCGSVAYAAPEVLSSKKYDGKKADIWSLGIILYVMLVGQVPFKSRHVKILYESIVNKEYKIPDYVPNDARDLIEKMLVLEPEKRIEMDDLLMHPWITNPIVTRRTSSGMGLMNIYDVKLANENEIIDRIIEICKNNNISENKINLQEDGFVTEQHSFDSKEFRESIINCISMDEPSSIKALYFLLKEEKAENLEKQMTKTWKLNSLEVAKENDVTVYESICENENENDELSTKEKEIQEKENARSQKFIHTRHTNPYGHRRLSSGNTSAFLNATTNTNANATLAGLAKNGNGSLTENNHLSHPASPSQIPTPTQTQTLGQDLLHGSEFIPRTPIDDHTTFMLLNGKYGQLPPPSKYLTAAQEEEEQLNSAYKTYGGPSLSLSNESPTMANTKSNLNFHTNDPTTSTTTTTTTTTTSITGHAHLAPPIGEMNSPVSAPPYQINTKFVYEIPSSSSLAADTSTTAPQNETLLEQIRRVKFNNAQQPISAPVERSTTYQPYLASFHYGIKPVGGGGAGVEDSMFRVQANTLFPPQLSKIGCSSFPEFTRAVCHYLKEHHIRYTESVNYEGEDSDIYHSYTSLDPTTTMETVTDTMTSTTTTTTTSTRMDASPEVEGEAAEERKGETFEEVEEDPMDLSLQNDRTIRTLIIDGYLTLEEEEKEQEKAAEKGQDSDLFIPNSLLESNSPTEAMAYLVEELSKQDRLADGIHFQMTIENILNGGSSSNNNNNSNSSSNHAVSPTTTTTSTKHSNPRTLYVRTLLDPTGVGPKEEKIFNDFIQDLVASLK